MKSLARFSLLVVAMIVAGGSLGVNHAWADALPKDTNKIESLTPEQATQLAEEFPGVEVEVLHGDDTGTYFSNALPLNGLKMLDADTARALSKYAKGPLFLNGLTTLDADAATALAKSTGGFLSLNGLTTLSADTAKALAEFKCRRLSLNGLTTLDAHAAKALTEFTGELLHLAGLTTLNTDSAKALVEFKGRIRGPYFLLQRIGGDVPLTYETARFALACNADSLPAVTAFDSPDSVAIAEVLAAHDGPLALPNLKQISPKTLTALIEKRDIRLPPIETLELILEPDGSVTEDCLIPDWLKDRQKQQRAVQAAE